MLSRYGKKLDDVEEALEAHRRCVEAAHDRTSPLLDRLAIRVAFNYLLQFEAAGRRAGETVRCARPRGRARGGPRDLACPLAEVLGFACCGEAASNAQASASIDGPSSPVTIFVNPIPHPTTPGAARGRPHPRRLRPRPPAAARRRPAGAGAPCRHRDHPPRRVARRGRGGRQRAEAPAFAGAASNQPYRV